MNGWIKMFVDGTKEYGADTDKSASWSRGKLSNMVGASAYLNNQAVTLWGNGDFWQSDDFEISLLSAAPTEMVTRRLQKKINSSDLFVEIKRDSFKVWNISMEPNYGLPSGIVIPLVERMRDKWFTVEIDVATKEVRHYFAEDRI